MRKNMTVSKIGMVHPYQLIVKGFRKAEEHHGLRYINFIGDGTAPSFLA